eukprot:scaffold518615_cov48-Prasinocladus_malaysianus.AAC.1
MQGATATAQALADGKGTLADGTKWEKKSGEELGPNGFIKRWTLIQGSSNAGKVGASLIGRLTAGEGSINFENSVVHPWQVEWEETWWEASDWSGMRELGAEKSG